MNLKKLVKIFTYGLIFISCFSSYFWWIYYSIDIFSHFQIYYFIGVLILSWILLYYKSYKDFAIIIIYLILLLTFFLFPYSFFSTDMKDVDVFYMNTYYPNIDNFDIVEYIKHKNPDIIIIVEPNKGLINNISNNYWKPILYHEQDFFSCAIFSRFPVQEKFVINFKYPICYAKIDWMSFFWTHTSPPLSQEDYLNNIRFFEQIKVLVESDSSDFLLVWDFNSTYFSYMFRSVFKWYFIWNFSSWVWFPFFSIPIDHAISNKKIKVGLWKKLSSDHRPLMIKFE